MNFQLTNWARLPDQQVPSVYVSLTPSYEVTDACYVNTATFYMGAGDLNYST